MPIDKPYVLAVWAAVRWRDPRLRLLLLYFVVGMAAIMLVNHPPNPRFIATFVPAAHLLTGAMMAWLFRRWHHAGQRQTRLNLIAAGLAILLAALLSLPVVAGRYAAYPSALEAFLETSPENSRLAAWLDQHLPDDATVLLINYWDQFSPQTLAWHLKSQQQLADADFTLATYDAADWLDHSILEPDRWEQVK